MTLTYDKALQLYQGLQCLDKPEFEVDDAKVSYRIAANMNRLEFVQKFITKERRRLQLQIIESEGDIPRTHPKIMEWNDAVQAVLDSEIPEDIKIMQVTLDQLKVKENKLAGPVIARLAPMISDFDKID